MANDDAIDEFAPEPTGESRRAQTVIAEPRVVAEPSEPSLDVFAAPEPDVYAAPDAEIDAFDAFGEVSYASPSTQVETFEPDSFTEPYEGSTRVIAPFESSGGIQIVAALATIGMLALMYSVLIHQRSSALVSFPSSPPPPIDVATESSEIMPAVPSVAADELVPPVPNPYLQRPFEDPFGLTRGLSPSLPIPEIEPPPAESGAAAENTPPPAAAPAAAPISAPTPVAAAASTSASMPPPTAAAAPSATPAVSPAPAPPAAAPAAAVVTPAVAPPTTSAAPPATAANPPVPAPRAAAPTPTPKPAAPGPTPPAPTAAAAAAASAPAAASSIDPNRNGIQNTLARYRKAFSSLNASAAREVWPTVNERSLSRAFDRLEQQNVMFDRCQIDVANDRAEATCNGTASYVPRVGSRTPRVDHREWRFNLVKVRDEWLIGAVDAR